ncbi:hypothetical protein EXIGLDRAFT_726856 [Exidia glandulosa HHB12029]|uniref:Uncharacterized protein n=1 Tax=Exidia glandulosa HHB12029 TaxID=1314781 RepID=A0A165DK77_EXIGL|nr:hypothetical protein EXIGLDRAFT_726856 [Exidia glandulosa HHB12029]
MDAWSVPPVPARAVSLSAFHPVRVCAARASVCALVLALRCVHCNPYPSIRPTLLWTHVLGLRPTRPHAHPHRTRNG